MYSVIIPSFNRCQLLKQAIGSVLQQCHRLRQDSHDLQIIVIDDGSSDDTAAMINRHYPQVDYVYQPNRGPSAARNHGIQRAQGELIAFLDSDDLWLEGKMDTELALFNQYPEAQLVAGNARVFIEGQLHRADTFAQRKIDFEQQTPRYFEWSLSIMRTGPVCCTSAMTFKRDSLLAMGPRPFDETLRFNEDWDFEFRFFSQFNALIYPGIVCDQRIYHDGTRSYRPVPAANKPREHYQLLHRQQQIIARYLPSAHWSSAIKQLFTQRYLQLEREKASVDLDSIKEA